MRRSWHSPTTNRRAVCQDLFKDRAVSASERDRAATDVEVAEAHAAGGRGGGGERREAVGRRRQPSSRRKQRSKVTRINLDYTKITAPISGRIGKSNVTEGAIVTAYQPTPLATIQELDPIYVDVPSVDQRSVAIETPPGAGRLQSRRRQRQSQVKLILEDGRRVTCGGDFQVPRCHGGPDDRIGHPADRRAQSPRGSSAGHVHPGGD